MNWQDILKGREHYPANTLSVQQLEDFHRRFRLEILPKLSGDKEEDAHMWLHWLEKALNTKEGSRLFVSNEYIIAQLQDIMDTVVSEKDSFKGME
jgi:hypothetical protein